MINDDELFDKDNLIISKFIRMFVIEQHELQNINKWSIDLLVKVQPNEWKDGPTCIYIAILRTCNNIYFFLKTFYTAWSCMCKKNQANKQKVNITNIEQSRNSCKE